MTTLLKTLLIVVLSLLFSTRLWAQEDSVAITYSEEAADSSSFSLKEKYDYWTRATIEETSIFKVGLTQLGFASSRGLLLEHTFGYEQKLTKAISMLGQYRFGMTNWDNAHMGADVAVRYYYSLPRRIRQGKSANNLSANYFSLQMDNTWRGQEPHRRGFGETQTGYSNQFSLLYGIQRRLGKRGYFDINIGPTYRTHYNSSSFREKLSLDFNFAIGFAF